MNFAKEARKLANFIIGLEEPFFTHYVPDRICYNHIGALYTDVILQAGLNYKSVVKPRVQRVLTHYPEANTVESFSIVLQEEGFEKVIKWKHPIKQERMLRLLEFSDIKGINTSEDLKGFLQNTYCRQSLLELNGFGPKSLDYLLKLLNFDSVAVDRHIYSFVELAEISATDYHATKKVVEFAADLLEVSRSSIDYSIWKFMSNKQSRNINSEQLALNL
ncbi:hypothetical protein POKO110462_16475 [Pontibacter korlensis]|uniref:HhH-GPD domain-containing protein n=1 Tax=Pontibacter korlensis TaxID=400092 RepID=A0A0E3ZGT3_9BACT|nr:hypothetical protein [Pontibacter korlensis]AKD04365.1 hypothetical protein PKOR_16320 [Pontibacter korlensis]